MSHYDGTGANGFFPNHAVQHVRGLQTTDWAHPKPQQRTFTATIHSRFIHYFIPGNQLMEIVNLFNIIN